MVPFHNFGSLLGHVTAMLRARIPKNLKTKPWYPQIVVLIIFDNNSSVVRGKYDHSSSEEQEGRAFPPARRDHFHGLLRSNLGGRGIYYVLHKKTSCTFPHLLFGVYGWDHYFDLQGEHHFLNLDLMATQAS